MVDEANREIAHRQQDHRGGEEQRPRRGVNGPSRRQHPQEQNRDNQTQTAKVDDAFLVPDEDSVKVIFDLNEHEGLCLGGSSGVNIAGAIQLARKLGPGKTIVTILCDSGHRYQSKLFNPAFMRSKNLPVPAWLEKPPSNIELPFEKV